MLLSKLSHALTELSWIPTTGVVVVAGDMVGPAARAGMMMAAARVATPMSAAAARWRGEMRRTRPPKWPKSPSELASGMWRAPMTILPQEG